MALARVSSIHSFDTLITEPPRYDGKRTFSGEVPIVLQSTYLRLHLKPDVTPAESVLIGVLLSHWGRRELDSYSQESILAWMAENNLLRHFDVS